MAENQKIQLSVPVVTPYQLAVDNGFKGTEVEWLESLKATINGKTGAITKADIIALGFNDISIEDSLDSTSSTNALSARQGRVLRLAIENKVDTTNIVHKLPASGTVGSASLVLSEQAGAAILRSLESKVNTSNILQSIASIMVDGSESKVVGATAGKDIVGKISENETSIKALETKHTQDNTTVLAEIQKVFQYVSKVKQNIASALTDQGASTSATDSFATMIANMDRIKTGKYKIGDKVLGANGAIIKSQKVTKQLTGYSRIYASVVNSKQYTYFIGDNKVFRANKDFSIIEPFLGLTVAGKTLGIDSADNIYIPDNGKILIYNSKDELVKTITTESGVPILSGQESITGNLSTLPAFAIGNKVFFFESRTSFANSRVYTLPTAYGTKITAISRGKWVYVLSDTRYLTSLFPHVDANYTDKPTGGPVLINSAKGESLSEIRVTGSSQVITAGGTSTGKVCCYSWSNIGLQWESEDLGGWVREVVVTNDKVYACTDNKKVVELDPYTGKTLSILNVPEVNSYIYELGVAATPYFLISGTQYAALVEFREEFKITG